MPSSPIAGCFWEWFPEPKYEMVTSSQPHSLLIHLFGGLRLSVQGRSVTTIPRKGQALLAYLAMQNGKPVSREAMADLLWTDRGAQQARHSLRQMVLTIRKSLGQVGSDALIVDAGSIALRPDRIWCDVIAFQTQAASDRRADHAEAAEFFTGPLLQGFQGIAADFDDWATQVRDHTADLALDVLGRLADSCTAAGDGHAAVLAAERMLAIDPLREDVHRRLMAAYVAVGRRADAIRQYNACVQMLRRDLDVAPAAETEALIWRIRTTSASDTQSRDRHETVAAQPAGGPPWIAVLPFRAGGPDPVPEYFATGLVEDIVSMLATLREPIVVSSNSTLGYRDRQVDLRQVGRELGVRYVVSGSIRRNRQFLRYAVELADAENLNVVWARPYDSDDGAPFDAQDKIVAQIVTSLIPQIYAQELLRIQTKRPEALTAYDLLLQARARIFHLDKTSFDEAGTLVGKSIELDPGYSAAHTFAADWHSLRIGQGWSTDPAADTEAVDRSSERAIAGDGANARALALLGHNRTILHRDYDHAQVLFTRAADAAPNDAATWLWSSPTFAFLGDGQEAIRRAELALRLSPRDPFLFRTYHMLCIGHYTNGSFDEAARWGQLSARENPRYTSNLRATAASLAAAGRYHEAHEFGVMAMDEQPDFKVGSILTQHAYRDQLRRQNYADDLIKAGLKVE